MSINSSRDTDTSNRKKLIVEEFSLYFQPPLTARKKINKQNVQIINNNERKKIETPRQSCPSLKLTKPYHRSPPTAKTLYGPGYVERKAIFEKKEQEFSKELTKKYQNQFSLDPYSHSMIGIYLQTVQNAKINARNQEIAKMQRVSEEKHKRMQEESQERKAFMDKLLQSAK